jgi:hypothetical protein
MQRKRKSAVVRNSSGDGLRGGDKQQDALRDSADNPADVPEGLKRPRKGPYGKDTGRHEDESVAAYPDRDPVDKKTGEF